jgi:hypothetical protein
MPSSPIAHIDPMLPVLLRASGSPMRRGAAPSRGQEGPRGSRNFPPEVARVLPGSADRRWSRSVAVLRRDGVPPCHAWHVAPDGASAPSLMSWPTPTAWRGHWSVPMSLCLLQASGPMGWRREEVRPCYRASGPVRPGSDRAYPLSFRPTDWRVAPKRVRRRLARQPPPHRSGDASCSDPLCRHWDDSTTQLQRDHRPLEGLVLCERRHGSTRLQPRASVAMPHSPDARLTALMVYLFGIHNNQIRARLGRGRPNRGIFACMASPAGLEPATHSLGNCCSILLSYGDCGTEDTPAARVAPAGSPRRRSGDAFGRFR